MEKVINLVIQQMEMMIQKISSLEYITESYHEYKKEKEDFIKYLNEKFERENKDRDGDSTCDDRQQKISESEGGDSKSDGGGKKKDNNKKKEENDNESLWNIIKGTV